MERPGTSFSLEINPRLPRRLARLEEIAHDLWYSWDRSTRHLFARLDTRLWNEVGHSPKVLLKRIDEKRLIEASEDPGFLNSYQRMVSAHDAYMAETGRGNLSAALGDKDLVAYFCAEFGFHESLPIYSGGLGILAGDHCKAASDLRLPFIGVGLLYRQGYFQQKIDGEGRQQSTYQDSDFDDLPVRALQDSAGQDIHVTIDLPGRVLQVKLWQVRVGHVRLVLLDTDIAANSDADRHITHRLYGGDRETRILQEIVLGVGGVRALAAIGARPTVWHMNEGHAAFQVLERVRESISAGQDLATAIESVAADTVFTTHTPVEAGHDRFPEHLVRTYFDSFSSPALPMDEIIALGRSPVNADFDMTALAVRGSRFQNGVSKIHGEVSARMLQYLWPQVPPEENPVVHVTNAVHVPTFLSPDWYHDFDRFLGFDWLERLSDPDVAQRVDDLPDHIVWSRHQFLKSQMLHLVRHRITAQHQRNRGSQAQLDRMLRLADPHNPDVLTIGFGRRFATYKRATLLFTDLERLRRMVGDAQRPVLFIFSGKAHPADRPGQELIRQLHLISHSPEFEGRLLLVEGYDLRLARRLVSGVDVWLNNPVYPLEASGTSGMKAGINGVVNLSVLDGWWDEGYTGDNGWGIKPGSPDLSDEARNAEESRTLYDILHDSVLQDYYDGRAATGYSPAWIRRMKRSIATILPQFTATRMVGDYVNQFYAPAARQGRRFHRDGGRGSADVASWKAAARSAWPGVRIRRLDSSPARTHFGERLRMEVAVDLNGLAPSDVRVELRVAAPGTAQGAETGRLFVHANTLESGEQRFVLDFTPDNCGRFDCRVRVYPYHDLLTHRFETGLMVWL